jgi:DNA-binding response OmpR family regulator
MRLLVVEDEEKLAQLLRRGLVAELSVWTSRTDGREGLELRTSYEYDLLILDLLLTPPGWQRDSAEGSPL